MLPTWGRSDPETCRTPPGLLLSDRPCWKRSREETRLLDFSLSASCRPVWAGPGVWRTGWWSYASLLYKANTVTWGGLPVSTSPNGGHLPQCPQCPCPKWWTPGLPVSTSQCPCRKWWTLGRPISTYLCPFPKWETSGLPISTTQCPCPKLWKMGQPIFMSQCPFLKWWTLHIPMPVSVYQIMGDFRSLCTFVHSLNNGRWDSQYSRQFRKW